MEAKSLPRLRLSLCDGESFLEFLSAETGLPASIGMRIICGVSTGRIRLQDKAEPSCFGVIHTVGLGILPTKNSYQDLLELVCPILKED